MSSADRGQTCLKWQQRRRQTPEGTREEKEEREEGGAVKTVRIDWNVVWACSTVACALRMALVTADYWRRAAVSSHEL